MEEIFRITFKSKEPYTTAKKTVAADMTALGITAPLFSCDDDSRSIICNHSHFYLRTLLRGTPTTAALGWDINTHDYFTNKSHDKSIYSVTPNVEGYKCQRQKAVDFYAARMPVVQTALDIKLADTTSRELVSKLLARPTSCLGEIHAHRAPKAA